jgi:hypothetical protein
MYLLFSKKANTKLLIHLLIDYVGVHSFSVLLLSKSFPAFIIRKRRHAKAVNSNKNKDTLPLTEILFHLIPFYFFMK